MTPPQERSYVPDRGDVVWLAFGPQAGRLQPARRPAVVLSPRQYNGPTGLAILCPVTSQAKGYPFEVPLPAGLPIQGVLLVDQVRTLDWRAGRASQICSLPPATTEDVLRKLGTLLAEPK